MEVLKKGVETKMDGLKNDMEYKMDGIEAGMESKMDEMESRMENMKNDLKEYMGDLTKLIQEMFPNGEKIVEETHHENKINVSRDFINSNVGGKNHHIPKMDTRKFDGKDPVTWILQMERYFDLHDVQPTKKVHIVSLYLEPNKFVWYRWICPCKKLFTWSIFMEEMIAHCDDTKRNTFFSQLINLKQKGSVAKHIEDFQKLT